MSKWKLVAIALAVIAVTLALLWWLTMGGQPVVLDPSR